MTRRRLIATALLLCAAAPAAAVVARVYPLSQVIGSSDWIAAGTSTGQLRLRLRPLKGEPGPSAVLRPAAALSKTHARRIAAGRSFVLFGSRSRGGLLFGFTDGAWFQAKKTGAHWSVVSVHPEMSRTWTGASADLTRIVTEVLAGKREAPAPNPKAKPSLTAK